MSKIIIANWKMKLSVEESLRLASQFNAASVNSQQKIIICPDFISLPLISASLVDKNLILGAQDSASTFFSALTGEVSPKNLKEIGVKYVILGHSERRSIQAESDKLINEKIKTALAAGLKIILCVGESKAERQAKKSKAVILKQLKNSLKGIKLKNCGDIIIAYEPVWAIGSGKAMLAQEAVLMADMISRETKKITGKSPKVLYGGSVDADNAKDVLKHQEMAGLLVGGASLKLDSFISLL